MATAQRLLKLWSLVGVALALLMLGLPRLSLALDEAEEVCIVALVRESESLDRIHSIINQHSDLKVSLFSSPGALRNCLAEFPHVVLVSHSLTMGESAARLVYQQQMPENQLKWTFFNERVIQGVTVGANLKTFTLLTCHTEDVLCTMPELGNLFRCLGVRAHSVPGEESLAETCGVRGLRSVNQLEDIIREIILIP